jgi:hypothetical protein
VLQGKLDLLTFAADGEVRSRISLGSGGANLIEIPGGDWHSFVFHSPGAVVLEIKPGPYERDLDKEFATWAPPEGCSSVVSFTAWLETATEGDVWCATKNPDRT